MSLSCETRSVGDRASEGRPANVSTTAEGLLCDWPAWSVFGVTILLTCVTWWLVIRSINDLDRALPPGVVVSKADLAQAQANLARSLTLAAAVYMAGLLTTGAVLVRLRRTTTALHETTNWTRSIVDTAADDAIIVLDDRGVVQSINRAAERILLYSADEVVGQHMGLMLPQPLRSQLDDYIDHYRRTGQRKPLLRENEGERKDSSRFPLDLAVSEVRTGRRVRFTCIVRDLTQHKLAETTLRDSQALYSSLVESLPVNVIRKDLEGRFVFANQAFRRLLQRPLENILGKTDYDFFSKQRADKYRTDDANVADTPGACSKMLRRTMTATAYATFTSSRRPSVTQPAERSARKPSSGM